MSQIGVFVLDFTRGKPAQGVSVTLQHRTAENIWHTVAAGDTDEAGCIQEFVPADLVLPAGHYRLRYETTDYFAQQNVSSLYPEIVIHIRLVDDRPQVLPLLIGPYGYSTYRGS
jgi:5-hydroxyisourate hydrolase